MNTLVFATHNPNKLSEVQALLPNYKIISLEDLKLTEEIPETGQTLKENALIKAKYVYDKFGLDCFADDTGLEVDALEGAPGVYSARYAGVPSDSEKNMEKLLNALKGNPNRSAQFKTVICLIQNGKTLYFEGVCLGEILISKTGTAGFGYDPIFKPAQSNLSFAQMNQEDKGVISHRGLAIKNLINYLCK
ncbi:MAG: RdgB/HAM1 family non-canonical purine NTP pyrophosphatase [Flavobacteriaceae bacterium]